MAIFSLHHSFVGRTTHPAGAGSLYARYITRPEACSVILGQRMPLDRSVYSWLDQQEQGDRKNARVIDRVVVALPAELTREQNIELLEEYAERMTEGRAQWMAAIHDGPGDVDNPHAHIIFRDRDAETGRRVMMTSEPGSTQRLRQGWEQEVNIALQRAGLELRVDSRSLDAQGIDREPQLHVGAGAKTLAEREHEFRSTEKQVTRLIDGKPTEVTVNYPAIDEGSTRFEENEARKLRNHVRAQEELAIHGPQHPGDMPVTDRVFYASLRLDALYRRAMDSGEAPRDDGDPLNAVIREHMAEREQGLTAPARTSRPVLEGELIPPRESSPPGSGDPRAAETEELKLRKAEFEKLKEIPGMEQMLSARDYLNALSWDRNEPPPNGEELHAYLVWQKENRIPQTGEARRRDTEERREPTGGDDPSERGPRRDAADLFAGAGLALIGRIADSLETLFDGRTGREVEKDEKRMADQRKIEQITEQQQRQQEAEVAKWRQVELDLYLAQRDRERHIDRGR